MPNTTLTIDMITREALRLAHEKATFIGTINRQFDSSWSSEGKTGDTLRIRIPSMYTRRTGSRVMDVQDSVQLSTSLVRSIQDGVDMRFNSRELALDLDSFSKLHMEPAMATLISGIEADVFGGCTISTYNVVGTAGTAISTLVAPGQARARLNKGLAPKGDRSIQVESLVMGQLVNGFAGYFNPSNAISEQYREGIIARTAMADYYENERVWTLTNISDVTTTLSTYTITDGDTSITVSSFATPTVGTVFTIANVYAVHPETKGAYAHLQQFAVAAGSTSSEINITPPIYLTGARRNVGQASGAALVVSTLTSAALTFVGDASTSYAQHLMYHRDAFTFATAELPLMDDAAKCVRRTYDGLSLRVWQASDIRNDELLTRIDILYGFAALRPQWACRIIGAAN